MLLSELKKYLYSDEEVKIVYHHAGSLSDKCVDETIILEPQYFGERINNYEYLKVTAISANDIMLVIEVKI